MFNCMLLRLKSLLSHPLSRGLDIDSPEANSIRSHIIDKKPFLKAIYKQWYTEISNSLPLTLLGPVLEIGSGGGFLKEFVPDLITSEILPIPGADILLDGRCLPFKENSLRGIVMVDVFHHLPRTSSFLKNAAGCVKPGGVIVMLEPWNTRWSRFVYQYLHHEPFDDETKELDFPEGGPLSKANSALPWIVFSRDKEKLEREYPAWRIQKLTLHTPFRYLISGGMSYISLSPAFLYKTWCRVESIFKPWMNSWAMFATIILINENN